MGGFTPLKTGLSNKPTLLWTRTEAPVLRCPSSVTEAEYANVNMNECIQGRGSASYIVESSRQIIDHIRPPACICCEFGCACNPSPLASPIVPKLRAHRSRHNHINTLSFFRIHSAIEVTTRSYSACSAGVQHVASR
jgi:hypothetical protein